MVLYKMYLFFLTQSCCFIRQSILFTMHHKIQLPNALNQYKVGRNILTSGMGEKFLLRCPKGNQEKPVLHTAWESGSSIRLSTEALRCSQPRKPLVSFSVQCPDAALPNLMSSLLLLVSIPPLAAVPATFAAEGSGPVEGTQPQVKHNVRTEALRESRPGSL